MDDCHATPFMSQPPHSCRMRESIEKANNNSKHSTNKEPACALSASVDRFLSACLFFEHRPLTYDVVVQLMEAAGLDPIPFAKWFTGRDVMDCISNKVWDQVQAVTLKAACLLCEAMGEGLATTTDAMRSGRRNGKWATVSCVSLGAADGLILDTKVGEVHKGPHPGHRTSEGSLTKEVYDKLLVSGRRAGTGRKSARQLTR